MSTLLAALTALMLFAMPVAAGDWEDALVAYKAGDYQKAFRLWKPFAQQGDAGAQYNLGLIYVMMYVNGKGVPEDNAKAVHWYRKAAEQGHARAQYNLGVAYDKGVGLLEDKFKAAQWYRKAAELGDVDAQVNLGLIYYEGAGFLKDYVYAYAWWSIAATRGRKVAKKNKGIIKKEMTPGQIAKAQKLSSELWEKYVVPFQ